MAKLSCDCPNHASGGRDVKQAPKEGKISISPNRGRFYALQAN